MIAGQAVEKEVQHWRVAQQLVPCQMYGLLHQGLSCTKS